MAGKDTIEIYRRILQQITTKKHIPPQWQKGQIIRLYKGKGKRGKCSNERGITLASNFGKVYERIINERAKEKVNMTENQAGGQKGKATTDHLLILNETINEIRNQGKPVYMAFLDVTKAYDKAWLDAIMYVMHKEGLTGPEWDLVKKMNENLTAKISTKHGDTREIKIKDSIRQGGVLSVLQYALLIDEINKEITKENLGTYIPSLDEIIGCLLWMDDVLLISSDPTELQKMLDITDEVAGKYHIEFGEPKSNTMKIGGKKECPKFRLGDMELKETDKYKYLGFVQNNKNNLKDHITALKGKVENTYQTILAIAGNKSFKNIEMQTIWALLQSCIASTITYSSEIWKPNKKETEKINQLMDNIIKRILMVPQTTPREALYIETGLLDPEAERMKNRILMEHRLTNNNSQRLQRAANNEVKKTWAEETKRIREQLKITKDDLEGTKPTTKKIINKKVRQWFKEKIHTDGAHKSKIKHLLDGKTDWDPNNRAEYMDKLNRMETSIIFKARTRMIPVKENFRNMHQNNKCRACEAEPETQQHILEECQVLHITGEGKVFEQDIFQENLKTLKEAATNIQDTLNRLEAEAATQPKKAETLPVTTEDRNSTARPHGLEHPVTRERTR